uniref:Uncharacterized protein n=1 Tax=Arundo donax TaxID=35708 RepID=A0A0A9BPQ2_ARUDO
MDARVCVEEQGLGLCGICEVQGPGGELLRTAHQDTAV